MCQNPKIRAYIFILLDVLLIELIDHYLIDSHYSFYINLLVIFVYTLFEVLYFYKFEPDKDDKNSLKSNIIIFIGIIVISVVFSFLITFIK